MTAQPIFHGNLKVADTRLFDGKGRDVITLPGGPQRLADCANALKDVFFPLAHVPAMENRIERLEQLRREAVARIPEEGQYEDTPETANETMGGLPVAAASVTAEETGRTAAYARMGSHGTPHGSGVTGGESAATNFEQGPSASTASQADPVGSPRAGSAAAAPALLRLEPAGEATAWPWRFDMENAPRGSVTISTRQTKDGPREVKTPKRDVIFVAGEDGHVTQSYWVPDAERWCMFTKDRPPIAWMLLPTFPARVLEREAA